MTDPTPTAPATSVQRRRLVVAVAAAATAAGAVVSWRVRGPASAGSTPAAIPGLADASAAPLPPAAKPASAPVAAPPDEIVTLDGRRLTPADWKGRPLVLNFWAPWCGPCVKEMPDLDRFFTGQPKAGGALVVGLAIDEEPAVKAFLAKHPVHFPIAVLGVSGLARVRAIANDPAVALPFTAVFGRDGTLSHRKFGPTDVDELTRWVK